MINTKWEECRFIDSVKPWNSTSREYCNLLRTDCVRNNCPLLEIGRHIAMLWLKIDEIESRNKSEDDP